MISSREVAKLAGVSVSTVSRAFREDVYISEDKKMKVMAAAAKLGYTPNLLARGLKNQESKIIGLISDLENPFYSIIARVVEAELRRQGFSLLLSHSTGDSERELDNLTLLAGRQVDGIIFIPVSTRNRDMVYQLKKKGIALVQTYLTTYRDIDSLVVNDTQGAYLATQHLIEQGHTDILMLDVKTSGPSRTLGYKQAMEEYNVPVKEELIITLPSDWDSSFSIIRDKLKDRRQTAVIAATNITGQEVIRASKELGLKIPEDISLVMFDDVQWASLMDITTIAQPMEYIGLSACRIVIDRILNGYDKMSPINQSFEPSLVIRNSVRTLTQ